MKRVFRLAGVALASVLVVGAFALLGAFAASEVMIRWPYEAPASRLVASSDPAAVERGHRVAVLNGCHDCHGEKLEGRLFHEEAGIVKAWAPNLGRAVAAQTDAQLDSAIRHGVAADGRPLWIMPSSAFVYLSDAETADLIAYLRTQKAVGGERPRLQVGPLGRMAVLLRKFEPEPALIAKRSNVRLPDYGPQLAAGRDTARLCIECHGAELKGDSFLKSPDLSTAAAYDAEDFRRLLHTGVATGDRQLGLMSEVAQTRFRALSDAEVDALHAYLKARAAAQPAI